MIKKGKDSRLWLLCFIQRGAFTPFLASTVSFSAAPGLGVPWMLWCGQHAGLLYAGVAQHFCGFFVLVEVISSRLPAELCGERERTLKWSQSKVQQAPGLRRWPQRDPGHRGAVSGSREAEAPQVVPAD